MAQFRATHCHIIKFNWTLTPFDGEPTVGLPLREREREREKVNFREIDYRLLIVFNEFAFK